MRIRWRLIILLLLMPTLAWAALRQGLTAGETAATTAKTRVALLAGISNYDQMPLKNPRNDVKLVAGAAEKAGFEVMLTNLDAGREKVLHSLREFHEQAQSAQVAMVYFAGMGATMENANYLLMEGSGKPSSADVSHVAVEVGDVIAATRGAKSRIVALDACFFPVREFESADDPWVASKRDNGGGDLLLLYSAAPGKKAWDGKGDNSPFAISFAQRLGSSDMPLQLLGDLVRIEVMRATKSPDYDFVQLPFIA